MSKESVKRVQEYIARRKKSRGIDVEHVHGFDVGPDCGVELLLSDIEAILSAAAPQVVADERAAYDKWLGNTSLHETFSWDAWQARAALQAAPVQPVAVPDGSLPELPPLPRTDVDGGYYDPKSGFTKKTMQEYAISYGQACHALGRGAAVREYVENGTFAAPAAQVDAKWKERFDFISKDHGDIKFAFERDGKVALYDFSERGVAMWLSGVGVYFDTPAEAVDAAIAAKAAS